jgi:hypothetical protein
MIQALHVEKPRLLPVVCDLFSDEFLQGTKKTAPFSQHNRNTFWYQAHTLFIINAVSSIPQGARHWRVIITHSRRMVLMQRRLV